MVAYSGTNGRSPRYLCSRTHRPAVHRRPCRRHRERTHPRRNTRHDPDAERVSIHQAARQLGLYTQTIRRWLAEGLLPAEQSAPHAPWRIHLSQEVRRRFVPHVPDDYVTLKEAARRLGLVRQTMLNQVRRDRRDAILGKRGDLRIQLHPAEQRRLSRSS
jgi:transposase-like protein